MRSVITREAAYVFNPWANGRRKFARLGGAAWSAMKAASGDNPALAARNRHLEFRTVEEFFDLTEDPNCLRNLAESADHQSQADDLRARLRAWMVKTKDPALAAFETRDQAAALERFVQGYRAQAQKVKEALRPYEKKKGYRF